MLKVNNISFAYKKDVVLEDISFNLNKGECLAIAGESGSGKSTLLKLLYGEYDLDQGEIHWNGEQILGPKFNLIIGPDFMKYVAQEFDLMPYTSVETNIGDFLSNLFPEKKRQRINELIEVVELEDVAKTKVKYLSGGQKQRVALARALAKEPEILLLDEPFSHIDNLKKQSLRRSLFNYLKEKNISCIVATHDSDDVISFADSLLFLYKGKTITHNTPDFLYNNPKNGLIASFFDEFNEFKYSEFSRDTKFGTFIAYPHQIQVVEKSEYTATVKQSYYRGNHYLLEADFNGHSIFIKSDKELTGSINFTISEELIKLRSTS